MPRAIGLAKERHRCAAQTVEHQLHHQRRHRAAFGEVHPVGVAPLLGGAGARAQRGPGLVDQVLDDRARLGHRDVAVADDRRLARACTLRSEAGASMVFASRL
jgi:hypothetical protein